MIWKVIGKSVAGTSHTATTKPCEDALEYATVTTPDGTDVLACCASDGAGSATHGGQAAALATHTVIKLLIQAAQAGSVTESDVYAIAEHALDAIITEADTNATPVDEYACTLLGGLVFPDYAIFFQVGDGAIVRSDGNGFYTTVWWPDNGEYQNTTSFLTDDNNLSNLKIVVLEEKVEELAIFTDGLQLLALVTDGCSVHQPFFTGLFKTLRMADDASKIDILNRKLAAYLDSSLVNERTDDDKTLLLATRL